jgi:hypothetical protein
MAQHPRRGDGLEAVVASVDPLALPACLHVKRSRSRPSRRSLERTSKQLHVSRCGGDRAILSLAEQAQEGRSSHEVMPRG